MALGLVAGRGVLEGMGRPQGHHLLLGVERELAARTTRGLLAWQCHPTPQGQKQGHTRDQSRATRGGSRAAPCASPFISEKDRKQRTHSCAPPSRNDNHHTLFQLSRLFLSFNGKYRNIRDDVDVLGMPGAGWGPSGPVCVWPSAPLTLQGGSPALLAPGMPPGVLWSL